jgi:hypothetical protein
MARHLRDGSLRHPYSALNLRLALAVFGLVFSIMLAALSFAVELTWLGWLAIALVVVTVVDLVVIMVRRRRRRLAHPGVRHSLFE